MKKFDDLREFHSYLTKIKEESRIFEMELLKAIALLVEEDAKRKFGEYQDSTGPYQAWEQLAEATQKDRIRQGYEPNNPLYRSGDLMNSIYSKIEEKVAAVGSNDPIMLWQEKGTVHIPARPALGPALFQNKEIIKKIVSKMMFAWLTNRPLKAK